ncbi:restriction endonuclease [Microbacterium album]|uniref:restriction endonuclease n=1 Tax=Microbacterium album TaxID=2053191 RepID=UPI001E5DECB9|nr:restriction endonuclease [Microbacterium album]
MIRAGRYGEREDWALEHGFSGGGWSELPDLTPYESREQIAELVARVHADNPKAHANYTGQLYALRSRVQPGDLLALPLKSGSGTIALGRVTGGYRYLGDDMPADRRHVVEVDWRVTDLPRTAVKQDLLYTLGSALTIFAPSRGAAEERLEALMQTGADPGQLAITSSSKATRAATNDDDVDDPETQTDLLEVARDRIMTRISEEFVGDGLEVLVAAILEAEGFVCRKSPIGADRGIDVIAGRGVLGMDSPRVVVQVKSGGQVSDAVVRDLSGVVHEQGADHGLLVAWGGLTRPAKDTVYKQQFRLRAWTAEEVVDAVLRTYDRLPDDIQSRLPLKRVWVLAD